MTLFEECKEALSADFKVVEGQALQAVIEVLHGFHFVRGNVMWTEMRSSVYENIGALLSANLIGDDVFVFADDKSIPIFRTSLKLISENIYDVIALSPKLLIFNDNVILESLFPTEMFRLGVKANAL
ncbi:CDI toxin immunity protein [Pseudomonas fluorescens]